MTSCGRMERRFQPGLGGRVVPEPTRITGFGQSNSVSFLLCCRARIFIDALWSHVEKGPASWLSFVMSNY